MRGRGARGKGSESGGTGRTLKCIRGRTLPSLGIIGWLPHHKVSLSLYLSLSLSLSLSLCLSLSLSHSLSHSLSLFLSLTHYPSRVLSRPFARSLSCLLFLSGSLPQTHASCLQCISLPQTRACSPLLSRTHTQKPQHIRKIAYRSTKHTLKHTHILTHTTSQPPPHADFTLLVVQPVSTENSKLYEGEAMRAQSIIAKLRHFSSEYVV